MKISKFLIPLAFILVSNNSLATDEINEEKTASAGEKCLSEEEFKQVLEAVRELDDIKTSKVVFTFEKPIIIIRDWDNRVFINGGEKKPLKMKLTIGKHIDRDLEVTVPIQVHYRDEPPDSWLRLRIRAQAGMLVPELIRSLKDPDIEDFWEAGIGWDFIHVPDWGVNLAAYTGTRSIGGGLGLDLTKNFGIYGGYSLVYDGLKPSALLSSYFSFN